MGQAASQSGDFFECGRARSSCGGTDNSKATPRSLFKAKSNDYPKIDLLLDEHGKIKPEFMKEEDGVLQRQDLRTSRQLIMPLHHAGLDDTSQQIIVGMNSDGDVIQDPTSQDGVKQKFTLRMPDTHARTFGQTANYVLRVDSEDTPNLGHLITRVQTEQEIVDALLSLLRAGAETLNLSVGRECLSLEFEKMQIVQQHDRFQHIDGAALAGCQLVTGFTFVTMFHNKLYPAPDPLQREFDRLREGKHTKAQLVREMQARGLSQSELERFKDAVGDNPTGEKQNKSRQYYHNRANNADELTFFVRPVENPGDFIREKEEDEDGVVIKQSLPTAQPGEEYQVVADIISEITKEIREKSMDPLNWMPLLSWEPMRLTSVKDCMHLAYQTRALGDEDGYVRMALRAVEIVANQARMNEAGSGSSSNTSGKMAVDMEDHERDAILSCNKATIDKWIERYLEGTVHIDRFEETFVQVCSRMLDITSTLIKLAERAKDEANLVLYLRTKADYLRYLYVWIPSQRPSDQEIQKTYEQALDVAQSLPPMNITTISAWVNLTVFHAEVRRDSITAASECRRGIDKESNRQVVGELTPADIFNWHLLSLNMEAFESRIVVFALRFQLASLTSHAEAAGRVKAPEPEWAEGSPRLVKKNCKARRNTEDGVIQESPVRLRSRTQEPQQKNEGGSGWCGEARKQQPGSTGREGGEEWNAKGGNSARSAMKKPETAVPEETEVVADSDEMSAVRGWLRSSPLRRIRNERDEPPVPDVQYLYWLEHVELAPEEYCGKAAGSRAKGMDDGDSESSSESSAGAPSEQEEDAMLAGQEEEQGAWFLVACAAKLKPAEQGERKESHGDDPSKWEWAENLCDQLLSWSPHASNSGTKLLRLIANNDQYKDVVNCLDAQGIVVKASQQPVGGVRLHLGDALSLTGDLEDRTVEDLRNGKVNCPVTLVFIPCLAVQEARVAEAGEYADVHECFEGFRDSAKRRLRPRVNHFSTLGQLCHKLKDCQKTRKTSGSGVAPRPLRGLSARRNPLQAVQRGCR